MNFATAAFLGFFVLVFIVYWLLPSRQRVPFLLVANYVFYAWWNWRLIGVLIVSTSLCFVCGLQIERAESRGAKRKWLLVNVVSSLAILGYFKYFNFFSESLEAGLALLGVRLPVLVRDVVMPLGISYYTFQTLSYTLDIYRGQIKATKSVITFATFASFFPHIVAGPITRARELLPQLQKEQRFSVEDLEIGLTRFLRGLFKKMFIADTLGLYLVDPVFANPPHYTPAAHWLAVAGYAVQVYADFSGYSSMALGLARMLGFRIPENFRYPYLSLSISEFWRRWHMTLSRWLRDYLWWPLTKDAPMSGGWRVRLRSQRSLLIVFLLCGLWHGATWVFVAWGCLHGFYIVTYEVWRHRRSRRSGEHDGPGNWVGIASAWLITQGALLLSWILFRAGTFGGFRSFAGGLVGSGGAERIYLSPLCLLALAAFVVDHVAGWLLEHRPDVGDAVPVFAKAAFYVMLLLFLFQARPEQAGQFIYFRF